MAEILLLHHIHGRTNGVLGFAHRLRAEGHVVHTPDLYGGRTFATMAEAQAFASQVGFDTLLERGVRAADDLPPDVVYAGFSLGVMAAQKLAQTRLGARGALLLHSFVPPEYFGAWPPGLPAQVHGMLSDPFFAGEGDLAAARTAAAQSPEIEIFTYRGQQHLFADASLASYDAHAATAMLERCLAFLTTLDAV